MAQFKKLEKKFPVWKQRKKRDDNEFCVIIQNELKIKKIHGRNGYWKWIIPFSKKGEKTRTKRRKLRRNRKNKQKKKKKIAEIRRESGREGKRKKQSWYCVAPNPLVRTTMLPIVLSRKSLEKSRYCSWSRTIPPEWNAFHRTAHYHRHARRNKLTSDKAAGPDNPRTSRWISLRIRLKNNVTPYVAADGMVNHEFSIGQRHSRRSAIIKLPSLVRKLLLITRVWLSLPFRRSASFNCTDFSLFLKL